MTFQATIRPAGYQFPIEENETLLDTALRHGYSLPYSCREGACGVCKGKVLEGEVDHGNYLGTALTETEKAAGMILFCCATPKSDLVIECHSAARINSTPIRIFPCRVHRMDRLSEEVMVLQLELPPGERLHFSAGQHIAILPKDQKPRNFSLANAPHDEAFLELHIRRMEGGTFTQHVFNGMQEGDLLRFKGPLGDFQLREESDRPAIFIVDSTGFAPVKAMIEHALHVGLKRPLYLYWGGRRPTDLYLLDKAQEWKNLGIGFTPVLSSDLAEDGWSGRTGTVPQAVLEDFADLSGHEVYACGTPEMVEAARRDFTIQRKLPDTAFFASVFTATPAFISPSQTYRSPFA